MGREQDPQTIGLRADLSDLDASFLGLDCDPRITQAMFADEVRRQREVGRDVDAVVQVANQDPGDGARLLELIDQMELDDIPSDWPYEQPDDLEIIAAAWHPGEPKQLADREYARRVHAGWLGRVVGCNIGKPVEWGDHWTVEHIRDYLTRADAYPLTDYVPYLDPLPEQFDLNASWPQATRGRIDGGARDDDIDYAILGLHILETHGAGFSSVDVGATWLEMLPLLQTFTAERAAYHNLVDGMVPPHTARHRNPYREWIGAQIRGDVYGWVNPGDPWAAARLAHKDATVSHTGNGLYGAMWSAALVASAFTADSMRDVVLEALAVVPPSSQLHEAVAHVVELSDRGLGWEQARQQIQDRLGHLHWVHTLNNAAIVALGLLWSEDDFPTAVGRTVMSGLDTDSNGATVGSVAGVFLGLDKIPGYLTEPLHDRTRSAVFGFDNSRISALAERTVAVRSTMHRAKGATA